MRTAAAQRVARLITATDADDAGDRFALQLAVIAIGLGAPVERLRPEIGEDWNDVLKARGG